MHPMHCPVSRRLFAVQVFRPVLPVVGRQHPRDQVKEGVDEIEPIPLSTISPSQTTSTNQHSRSSLGGVIRTSQLCAATSTVVVFGTG
jgi:hypothetical protein